jgi:hypothetical protein
MADRIEPFVIAADEAALDDLTDRLRRARWPERETVGDWSQGAPLSYLQDLCGYWAGRYDWRAAEARLNQIPQFTTRIDGLRIHFLHIRSPHRRAVPLIMTHGWPGSFLEFEQALGPLTDPPAHGGDAADAFDVVVPSLPGYGFSGKPAGAGWDVHRIARAWAELMTRLVLADRHRRLLGPAVLGEHRPGHRMVHHRHRRHHRRPDRMQHLPQRSTAAFSPLGPAALHQHCVLERTRPRRPLRRVGTAQHVHQRSPRRRTKLRPAALASGNRARIQAH